MASRKKNMDVFLKEVFVRYIAIQDADYKKAQSVFNSVFDQVKQKMCEQDSYYGKYANEVLNAGSVYDGIKVGRLDEFDLDVVVRLPISYEDGDLGIVVENQRPGFVKLKIASAFDHLDKQQDWEKCHKVTRDWRDADKYFLQNKFRQWMHRVVQRAVNDLGGQVSVGDVVYLLTFKESGPAYTLNIRNQKGAEAFTLDVDLVPCIRFMLPRWPEGYRSVEGSQEKKWLVVPKPLKSLTDATLKNRCWRLAFHDFEREHIKGCDHLKMTIRLLKKLRDALELREIASYYIKTLFLWEIDERQDKKYWRNKISVLFQHMTRKLYEAVDAHNIPYFWQRDHNLIEGLKPSLQKLYASKLKNVVNRIETNDIDSVVAALLTPEELVDFRSSEFYQSFPETTVADVVPSPSVSRQESNKSITAVDGTQNVTRDNETNELLRELLASNKRLESKFESLIKRIENKVDCLSKTVDDLNALVRAKPSSQTETGDTLDSLKDLKISDEENVKDTPVNGEMIMNVLSSFSAVETGSDLLINI
ncbi:unnamed protein product [Plutella xylostella]|uniref:(diamondback moth) hypothetical protein n=1 Tax=Plutella xylostella TaxID=51655 RepID=A0A8S4EJC5_PLUXY|nr:unnamed protein product [Plutella xylostella]